MAQHHGAGFPGFPGYPQPAYPPSMDAMANAPFDDVIHHINNVNYQLAHVHHQLHQQMHQFHHGLPMQLAPSHPPPTFQHNVHQFNNFHRNMMTHNIHIHQAMQDMARMQNAMVDAMNQNLMTVHSVHTNYAIQGRVPVPMMHHHPHVHPAARANHHDYESMLRLDESVKKKGVSEADLAKLKRVKFSTREKCKQCGICQENFAVGAKVISLPCKHIYCEEEILTWFDQHKTCPTCRHVVENVEAY